MPDQPRVAHIGVAVPRISEALAFYRDILGIAPAAADHVDGATIVSIPVGDLSVELLEPITDDSPVGRFLARRGPGIHHICFKVPDLEAALERCRKAGLRLIDEAPRTGAGGHRIAFLHPKTTAGILLELTE